MHSVFQIKKPGKVILKICLPFLAKLDCMMFSIATNIGTKPINSRKVVYEVGGQAIQSNNPDSMESSMFFFMLF